MLLAFILIILMIGIGVMASMYSIFLPFFQNLGDLTDYNVAYYGAHSSIERGMLVTKYQDPGFEGSGGRIDHSSRGPASDAEFSGFSRFNYKQNGIYREIDSKTTSIPKSGQGNVPYLLAGENSEDYNILDYQNIENFILSTDNTTNVNDYYKKDGVLSSYNGNIVEGVLRLPPKIYEKFGNNTTALLCDDENNNDCDSNNDSLYNEKIVTRGLEGTYDPMGSSISFQIMPKTAVFYNQTPSQVDILFDSNIRESTVDNTSDPNIIFANNPNQFNPIIENNSISLISGHNTISDQPQIINNLGFEEILNNSYSNINLQLNYLLQSQSKQIYPFLEYKFDFGNHQVADRFFSINGYGKVGNYNVHIEVKKPTFERTTAGDFTIIF